MLKVILYHYLKKGVRSIRVEDLITVHHRYQVFGIAEVNDVMGVAWEHVDTLDIITCHFKLDDFIRAFLAFLDETMSLHNDEKLPLAVVSVLSLGNAWLADVDAHLSAFGQMYQLGERASVIHVHLQRIGDLLLGQI